MVNKRNFFGTPEAAQQLGMGLKALQVWVWRHPAYRPSERISDDMLWSAEDIDRVRQARQRTAKHGNRRKETI